MIKQHPIRDNKGSALLIAVALLALFTILGTNYITHMTTELDAANYEVARSRARMLALAGINAAIGDLDGARRRGNEAQALGDHQYRIPSYKGERTEQGIEVREQDNVRHDVSVTVADESGKVNLNHAPASVLQRILGVDGETARDIVGSLPRESVDNPDAQWLLSPDDLLSRGLLSAEQYARVNPDLVTTYTVLDHENPASYLNINAAPPEVVAAVLDTPEAVARRVSEGPAFSSVSELAEIAGKDPSTFNIKPLPEQPGAFPPAFALKSRCYRLRSEARYVPMVGQSLKEGKPLNSALEAVVYFNEDGTYDILSWSTDQVETEE